MVCGLARVNTHPYGWPMTSARQHRLSRADWIAAGFRALSTDGPNGLRVEPLARAMKVSKGSFYWHFSDLAAFRTAMLDFWQAQATEAIITRSSVGAPAPERRLEQLIHAATEPVPADLGGAGVERALREWARQDPAAASVRRAVDARRLSYLERLFTEAGSPAAARHARTLYAALIGFEELDEGAVAATRAGLLALLALLLAETGS